MLCMVWCQCVLVGFKESTLNLVTTSFNKTRISDIISAEVPSKEQRASACGRSGIPRHKGLYSRGLWMRQSNLTSDELTAKDECFLHVAWISESQKLFLICIVSFTHFRHTPEQKSDSEIRVLHHNPIHKRACSFLPLYPNMAIQIQG